MSPSSNSTNICILCAILGKWLQNCLVKSLIPAGWCISGRYHKNGKGAWCVGFSALACPLATDAQYMTVRQAHIGLHGKSPGWPTGPKQTPYQAEDSCSLTLYTLSNSAQSSRAETLPFQGRPILQSHILCFFFYKCLLNTLTCRGCVRLPGPGLGFLSVSNSTSQQTAPLKGLYLCGKLRFHWAAHQTGGWCLPSSAHSVCFHDSE